MRTRQPRRAAALRAFSSSFSITQRGAICRPESRLSPRLAGLETPSASTPGGPRRPGRRRQMFGQQAGAPVHGLLALASAVSSLRRWLLDRAAPLPQAGRGLICGLVYARTLRSIRGHRLPLSTQNDWRGCAETAIRAPEKRKVGSSILPLTTTLTRENAESVISAALAC